MLENEVVIDEYLYTNKQIEDFEHLIGCEFVLINGVQKGNYVRYAYRDLRTVIVSNKGYTYCCGLTNCLFYLEDDTVVSYWDYMAEYYPEHRGVWEKQV